ncbi:MAG: hypothetical protein ACYCX3_11350 [Thermoleophilia bacterium]
MKIATVRRWTLVAAVSLGVVIAGLVITDLGSADSDSSLDQMVTEYLEAQLSGDDARIAAFTSPVARGSIPETDWRDFVKVRGESGVVQFRVLKIEDLDVLNKFVTAEALNAKGEVVRPIWFPISRESGRWVVKPMLPPEILAAHKKERSAGAHVDPDGNRRLEVAGIVLLPSRQEFQVTVLVHELNGSLREIDPTMIEGVLTAGKAEFRGGVMAVGSNVAPDASSLSDPPEEGPSKLLVSDEWQIILYLRGGQMVGDSESWTLNLMMPDSGEAVITMVPQLSDLLLPGQWYDLEGSPLN